MFDEPPLETDLCKYVLTCFKRFWDIIGIDLKKVPEQ